MATKLTSVELKKLYDRYCKFQIIEFKSIMLSHSYEVYKKWRSQLEPQLRFYKFLPLVENDISDVTNDPEFIEMDAVCRDHLRGTMEDFYKNMIENAGTSFAAMSLIDQHFQGTKLVRNIRVIKRIAAMITDRRDEIDTVIVDFKNIVADLKQLHSNLSDSILIALFIATLPPDSDNIVKRIMELDERKAAGTELKLDSVMSTIINENQLTRETASSVGSNAMKMLCSIKSGKNDRSTVCFYCNEEGHFMSKCNKLAADQASGKVTKQLFVGGRKRGKRGGGKSKQAGDQAGDQSGTQKKTENKTRMTCAIVSSNYKDELDPNASYIDTGTNDMVTNKLDGCIEMDWSYRETIYMADEHPLQVIGRGDYLFEGSNQIELKITKMLYAPGAKTTFISWSRMDDAGGYEIGGKKGALNIMTETGKNVIESKKVANGLYKTNLKPIMQKKIFLNAIARIPQIRSTTQTPEVVYWHRTLNHVNRFDLQKLDNALGILVDVKIPIDCITCIEAKMKRDPFKLKGIRSSQPLEIVHSDLSGIIRIPNRENVKYFVVFLDDYTRYKVIFLLARKFQVLNAFKEFVAFMKRQTGLKVKCLKTDNGTEYCNNLFDEYLGAKGIRRELTVPGTPQTNGAAERCMQTLCQGARCNLIEANLDAAFWPQALACAGKIENCLPNSAIGGKIPAVELFGKSIRYDDFKPFGSPVMAIVLEKTKFGYRGEPGLVVDFPTERSGYEVYLLKQRVVKPVREVKFLSPEERRQFIAKYGHLMPSLKNKEILQRLVDNEDDALTSQDRYLEYHAIPPFVEDENRIDPNILHLFEEEQTDLLDEQQRIGENGQPGEPIAAQAESGPSVDENRSEPALQSGDYGRFAGVEPPPNGRYLLTKSQVEELQEKFGNSNFQFVGPVRSATADNPICRYNLQTRLNAIRAPKNYNEAISSEHSERWKAAMDEEYASLVENGTWTLVQRPPGVRVLPTMWMYTLKTNRYGEIERYKARCVVLGNKQISLEPQKTYAPVVNVLSMRIVLALIAKYKMHGHGFDIKTAFLNAEIQEEVFIYQLKGYEDPDRRNFVCRLNKSMYGLKCSGANWHSVLVQALLEFGLVQLYSDECLFSNCDPDIEYLIILAIHVDDGLLASRNLELINRLKAHLMDRFEMTDHGEVKEFLGYSIDYNRSTGVMKIDQKKKIAEMLQRFGMENCKPQKNPVGVTDKLMIEHDEVLPAEERLEYQEITGGINYIANCSRPDLAYLSGVLCRYISKPARVHYDTAKRILRYLKGTMDSKLIYGAVDDDQLVIYSDADHANCQVSSKSISGICTLLGGCLVGWSSYKQNRVAGSTCESEILATLDGVNEAEFVHELLRELKIREKFIQPATLFNDNKGANQLLQSGGKHRVVKHFKRNVNQVRRAEQIGVVKVHHESGVSMVSDVFTKRLPYEATCALLQVANFDLKRSP